MDDENLLIDNTVNYEHGIVVVVVVGMFLVVVALALYKIYVDHQHNQAKEQEYWEVMEEYQYSKFGLATKLQHEVIATQTDSMMQRMKQEESEQALRQRHKEKIKEQEKQHHSHKQMLKAKFEQKQKDLKKDKQNSQEQIEQLQRDVSAWKHIAEYYESELRKRNEEILAEADIYKESHAKHDREIKEREENIAKLKMKNEELEVEVNKEQEKNRELQRGLEQQKMKQEGVIKKAVTSVTKTALDFSKAMVSSTLSRKHDSKDNNATNTSHPEEPADEQEPVDEHDNKNGNATGQESPV